MAKSVHLVFGDDEYRVSAAARELVNALVPAAEQAFGLDQISGAADTADAAVAAVNRCTEAVQTAGFLGAGKVVWFRGVNFLFDCTVGGSAAVKSALDVLAGLIKGGLPFGINLVISSQKVDGRSSFFKACKAAADIQEFSVPDKDFAAKREAGETLAQMLTGKELRMSRELQAAFIERVGTETRQIANEIEKLLVFLRGRREVQKQDVEAVVCVSSSVPAWDLADAVGERDAGRALALVRRLLDQRASPVGLIMGLETRIRELIVYREALESRWLLRRGASAYGWGELPPEAVALLTTLLGRDPRAMHPFRVGKLAAQAQQHPLGRLRRCQDLLAAAHEALVSSPVPQPLVLEMVVVRMLS